MNTLGASLFSLRRASQHPQFRQGAGDAIGVAVGMGAWGLVTGIAMVKSGLGVGPSLLMTAVVYAGSAQLAALPLLAAGAPLWVLWLTAVCINLRFVIFSSMWRTYFGHLPLGRRLALSYFSPDAVYVSFIKRFPTGAPAPGQQEYFWGSALLTWIFWQVSSVAGIALANHIPLSWGLGFAGVLALLGLMLSLVTNRRTAFACVLASLAAVAASGLPLRMNIVVAIAAAVAGGLLYERFEQVQSQPGSREA